MITAFNNICAYRRITPGVRGSKTKVTDPILDPVKKDLQDLKSTLEGKFQKYQGFDFTVEVSKGQSNFPSVLHVCILPPKQAVPRGIYVAICFDKQGRGALVGCAESVTNPQGLNTEKRKQPHRKLDIDVDGLRPTTKYNNSFENPREFPAGLQSDAELLSHIKKSLDLALYHIGLRNAPELTVGDRVTANKDSTDFDPHDVSDARDKIARQITARRGQKKFRTSLLRAYGARCAVSSCDVESVLEAAHICPYRGDKTNHVQNGVLLRSDLHVLFDLALLTMDCESKVVKINEALKQSPYWAFNGMKISLPKHEEDHPSDEALRLHNEDFNKR